MLGSIIGGIATLGGAFLGKKSSDKATSATQYNAAMDRELQKEFAQQGIRWRVEDAKKAGIHPLYSLGASIPTYSPNPISISGDTSLSSGLASAGQDIGRAIDATRTQNERKRTRAQLQALENSELQNELLRAQIASIRARTQRDQIGPPMGSSLPSAMSGQPDGDVGGNPYDVVKAQISTTQPGHPSQKAGAQPDVVWMRTKTGLQPMPNMDVMEETDITNPAALPWYGRHMISPMFGGEGNPPPKALLNKFYPGAKRWKWVWFEWRPDYGRKKDHGSYNFGIGGS